MGSIGFHPQPPPPDPPLSPPPLPPLPPFQKSSDHALSSQKSSFLFDPDFDDLAGDGLFVLSEGEGFGATSCGGEASLPPPQTQVPSIL